MSLKFTIITLANIKVSQRKKKMKTKHKRIGTQTHARTHVIFLLFRKTNESVDLVLKGGEKCSHQLKACSTFIVISHARG